MDSELTQGRDDDVAVQGVYFQNPSGQAHVFNANDGGLDLSDMDAGVIYDFPAKDGNVGSQLTLVEKDHGKMAWINPAHVKRKAMLSMADSLNTPLGSASKIVNDALLFSDHVPVSLKVSFCVTTSAAATESTLPLQITLTDDASGDILTQTFNVPKDANALAYETDSATHTSSDSTTYTVTVESTASTTLHVQDITVSFQSGYTA